MPSVDLSSTIFNTRTASGGGGGGGGTQPAPLTFLSRYGGGFAFVVLISLVLYFYIASVINTLVGVEHRSLQLVLTTHMYVFATMVMWCYLQTHVTHPARIAERFHFTAAEWQLLESRSFVLESLQQDLRAMATARGVRTRSFDGSVNCCLKCRLIKPERTHHCSICNICVVKMDHHCPWFGNCIHFHNFKYFLLCLFYSVVGLMFVPVSAAAYIVCADQAFVVLKHNQPAMVSFVIVNVIGTLLGVAVGGFFITSFYHALHNATTLEDLRGSVLFANGQQESYNLGPFIDNLKEQFGPVILAWFVPIRSSAKDGTVFLVRSDVQTKPHCTPKGP